MAELERAVLEKVLSLEECKELIYIHKCCSTVGYRPHVQSTTLQHLVASNCAALIMPFIPIRERILELVESIFKCEMELFVEFTGLISWRKGSSIGWHADNNRPYLKQRHYSAVCYLNDYEEDFSGGLFHFKSGSPQLVKPSTGTVIIYSADDTNLHCVDEVVGGERCTLAMWFTRDVTHNEDTVLLNQLSRLSFAHHPSTSSKGTLQKETVTTSRQRQFLSTKCMTCGSTYEGRGKISQTDAGNDHEGKEDVLLNNSFKDWLLALTYFKEPLGGCFPLIIPLPQEISCSMYQVSCPNQPTSPTLPNMDGSENRLLRNTEESQELEDKEDKEVQVVRGLLLGTNRVDISINFWNDIRLQKLNELGFIVSVAQEGKGDVYQKITDGETLGEEWLNAGRIFLDHGQERFPFPFRGILHALQVAAFWDWQFRINGFDECEPTMRSTGVVSNYNYMDQADVNRKVWAKCGLDISTSREVGELEEVRTYGVEAKRAKRSVVSTSIDKLEESLEASVGMVTNTMQSHDRDVSTSVPKLGNTAECHSIGVVEDDRETEHPHADDKQDRMSVIGQSSAPCKVTIAGSDRLVCLNIGGRVRTLEEGACELSGKNSCLECNFCAEWRQKGGSVRGLLAIQRCNRYLAHLWNHLQRSLTRWQSMGCIYDVVTDSSDLAT